MHNIINWIDHTFSTHRYCFNYEIVLHVWSSGTCNMPPLCQILQLFNVVVVATKPPKININGVLTRNSDKVT